MSGLGPSSPWAVERFGDNANLLRREVPLALHAAHRRALDAHLGLGLDSNEAYGLIWRAQHEELVGRLKGVEGVSTVKPHRARYRLVVINNVVLYPWRYGPDAKTRIEEARMRLSDVRRDMLALGTEHAVSQMTLDQATRDEQELADEYEAAREVLAQMAEFARSVVIGYASHPRAGILNIEWGDASLADGDGHLAWTYREQLPLSDPGEGTGTAAVPVRPAPRPDAGVRRFDDAPLSEPQIDAKPPATETTSEPIPPQSETGTDEQ